jgi:ankyrin repeat protein
MHKGGTTMTIPGDDPIAVELVTAIRTGDVDAVGRLAGANSGLAVARLGDRGETKTALHVVTDWPGYFPNGPQIARVLLDAGADPNAGTTGKRDWSETPLHWAASSDDADVAAVLIDGGADMEVPNGSIGTPLDNAVGYACWHVARLLVAAGARVDKLWHAGALGLLDRLEELLAEGRNTEGEISQAFWHACAGGQRRAAEFILAQGADLNWEPDYAKGTALDAAGSLGTRHENVITWLRELGAASVNST